MALFFISADFTKNKMIKLFGILIHPNAWSVHDQHLRVCQKNEQVIPAHFLRAV